MMHEQSTHPEIDARTSAAWHAAADWYHAFFTGIVLSVVTRCGTSSAAELVYRVFCNQRTERFLPGLKKLGIDKLPHAVAAAQYHYLSNNIGGVAVEYMYESDRKAWVRYTPPRWLWAGTALCGIPSEVSAAMLKGWHAQNGVSLGNPRLGFVCTKQTVDGQSALEGYYYEYDHPLEPHERLRFARGEDAPDFDADAAPKLGSADWPRSRIEKARRNYGMEYVRTTLPTAVELFGPHEAVRILRLTARMIGMQFYHQTAQSLGVAAGKTASDFAAFMLSLAQAQGDQAVVDATGDAVRVTQTTWSLFQEANRIHPAVFDAWNGLLEGALAAHNHRLALEVVSKSCEAPFAFTWAIRPAGRNDY
jgi:hypothetical protein